MSFVDIIISSGKNGTAAATELSSLSSQILTICNMTGLLCFMRQIAGVVLKKKRWIMLDPHVLAEVLSFPKQNPNPYLQYPFLSWTQSYLEVGPPFHLDVKSTFPNHPTATTPAQGTSTEVLDEAFALRTSTRGRHVAKTNKASDTLSPNFEIQTNGHNSRVHWWKWCTQVASTLRVLWSNIFLVTAVAVLTLQHSSHGALEL